jgi:hypothetical protein
MESDEGLQPLITHHQIWVSFSQEKRKRIAANNGSRKQKGDPYIPHSTGPGIIVLTYCTRLARFDF